mgnify:CR=1 FL=1
MNGFVHVQERAPRACGDDPEQLQQHVGHGFRVAAFWSTGACFGSGFNSDVEWRIYAPKGTRGMYVEPISASGNGDGISWSGVSGQRSFGGETEFVIHRGGTYRIERRQVDESESPKVIVWAEHHPELGYDLFQQDERDDNERL